MFECCFDLCDSINFNYIKSVQFIVPTGWGAGIIQKRICGNHKSSLVIVWCMICVPCHGVANISDFLGVQKGGEQDGPFCLQADRSSLGSRRCMGGC